MKPHRKKTYLGILMAMLCLVGVFALAGCNSATDVQEETPTSTPAMRTSPTP